MRKGQYKDITGQRNGKVVAVCMDRRDGNVTFWKVRCDCGHEWIMRKGNFANTTQCKPCSHKALGDKYRTHGMSRTRYHQFWIRRRADMCDRWQADFAMFYAESGAGDHVFRKWLVPTDPSRPIGPDNYSWRMGKDLYTVGDFAGTASEWSRKMGVSRERIRQLLKLEGGNMAAVVARLKRSAKERMIEGARSGRSKNVNLYAMLQAGGVVIYSPDHKKKARNIGILARNQGYSTRTKHHDGYTEVYTMRAW